MHDYSCNSQILSSQWSRLGCGPSPPNQSSHASRAENGTRVAAFFAVGFMLKAIWLAMLVAATYPVAVGAQVVFDWLFGDALLLTEWLHGSRRTAAYALIQGWIGSIPWVLGFWAIAMLLRAASGPRRNLELWALMLVGSVLVAAILLLSVE